MNRTAKILWVAVLVAIASYAVLYVNRDGADNGKPNIVKLGDSTANPSSASNIPVNKLANFKHHAQPRPLPEMVFTGPAGQPLKIESFKGKVILMNIWATWCAPCRHEMPSLNSLQKELGSDQFEVVALSIDRSGLPGVEKFLKANGAPDLKAYVDPTTKLMKPLKVEGMPTTLLLDREGREIGRLTGPADWASDAAKAIIKTALNTQQAN